MLNNNCTALVPLEKYVAKSPKVTVITITNPFKPHQRSVLKKDFQPGKGLDYYTGYLPVLSGVELVASINGKIVKDWSTTIVQPGDYIAVCPLLHGGKGKSILRIVALLVVIVASIWVPNHFALTGITADLVKAGIAIFGSMIVNAILPPPKPDFPRLSDDSWKESPTYSWNLIGNVRNQGGAIPIIYGTHRVYGQVISRTVEIDGDKSYLNELIAVCGHEVDEISDIWINEQPSGYFHDVETYTRLGTASDTAIPNFDEVASQQTFNSKLEYASAIEYETDGNSVEKIKVQVVAPYGCYYANDQGGLDEREAKFQVSYKKDSDSSWTVHGNYTISGATTKRLSKTVVIDDLEPAKYHVKVERTNQESTSPREKTTIYWVGMVEIIKRSLTYPGIAKYAIRALATDQLSGTEPRFSALVKRNTVQVYDPSSGWVTKSAQNPAWAYYDLLVNDTYGGGIDHTRIDYDAIKEWADWCDELVDGTNRFRLNIVIDQQMSLWEAALKICQIGRAIPVRKGTLYSVVVDMPKEPVQLFTTGSIIGGTYKISYLPKKDRANAIEVTFLDENRDYKQHVISVYSSEYNDSDEPDNKQSMRLFGCTNRQQAIREAAYRLNCNKYLVRSIEFSVDIESLACQVGDAIWFQHERPTPETAKGGRVYASDSTSVTLDTWAVCPPGATCKVLIRQTDDTLEEKTVTDFSYLNNLLTNPDFEKDSIGDTTPTGWSISGSGSYSAQVYSADDDITTDKRERPFWSDSSAHVLYVHISDQTSYMELESSDYIPVSANEDYCLSEWLFRKSGSCSHYLGIKYYDSSHNLLSEEWLVEDYDPTELWSQIYKKLTTPANCAYVKVKAKQQSEGETLLTRFQLCQGESPVEWLTVLEVESPWSTVPEPDDAIYTFGVSGYHKKQYTVTSISRDKELIKKIKAVEYNENIYSDTGYVFDEPTWDPKNQEATAVFLHEYLTFGPDGSYQSNVSVTWHSTLVNTPYEWDIWLEDLTDGTSSPTLVGHSSEMYFSIGPQWLTLGHQYKVYVTCNSQGPIDLGGNTATITIQGEYAPPSDVATFSGTYDSVTRNVNFTWSEIDDIDLDHYEIRRGGTTWSDATCIIQYAHGSSASWYVPEAISGTVRFWIKAVDKVGVYSENAAYCDVDIDTSSTELQTPTGLTLTSWSVIADDGTDRVYLKAAWNNNAENSDKFHHYDVRLTKDPSGSGLTSDYSTTNTQYTWEVLPNSEYGVQVRAVDIGGNATEWSTMVTTTTSKDSTPPSAPTISLTEFFSAIRIDITHGGEYDLDHFDIYKNSTNDSSTATKIGSTSTTSFVYTPEDRNTYYYWSKSVDNSGNESDFSNSVSGKLLKVDTDDLEDELITSQKLVDSAVTEAKVAADAITTTKISDGAIESPKIAAGAITASKIATGAVITEKIDAYAITSQKISTGAITADKISSNAITTNKIQSGAITTDKLDSLAVTTDKLAANSVTASKIDVTKLSDINPNAGVITAGTLQSSNWSSSAGSKFYLGDGTFYLGGSSSPKLSWNGTTLKVTGEINVTGGSWSHSSDGTKIDGGKIYTGTVTATQLIQTAAVITKTAQIKDGIITSAKIGNAQITTAKIDNAAITSAKIGTAAVERLKVKDGDISKLEVSYGDSQINVSSGGGTTIISDSITTYSSKHVAIFVGFEVKQITSGMNNHTIEIYRNSTCIRTVNLSSDAYYNHKVFLVHDTPGSGTFTYYIKGDAAGCGFYARKRTLILLSTFR